MQKFHLVLVLHAHQPVGNFDDVLEGGYAHAYLPFLEMLQQHPAIRLGLHFSGCLLEWIESAHPEYFALLRALVARQQVELLGGGFYEPILIAIPEEDRREQISRLSDYLEAHFGSRPEGGWLAERVWEPQLPSSLAAAGLRYTLVDDHHFLCAGLEPGSLYGYYLVGDLGAVVRVIPGLKSLRYLLPYRSSEEILAFLSGAAHEHPGGFAAMGDDLEKFGVWPKSFEHCYGDKWLEQFFKALEDSRDWLETATPREALAARPPLGRAALPAASYNEMMAWTLPTEARLRFEAVEREFSYRPDVQAFLRGGIWRNFLSKYTEANLLHKKMLHVSGKARAAANRRAGRKVRDAAGSARPMILRGQCNDAYWHGVFGGLYLPHLRTELWRSLIRAESILDAATHRKTRFAEAQRLDFDGDDRDELYLISDQYTALISAADGATMPLLEARASAIPLINSMQRRFEAYHRRLLAGISPQASAGAASIHDQVRTKEPGLEKWLRYDRWPRNAFRLLLFARGKTQSDYMNLALGERPGVAGGVYNIQEAGPEGAILEGSHEGWRVRKDFAVRRADDAFSVSCDVTLTNEQAGAASEQVGIELVINFLAPADPDRYFDSNGSRYPLRSAAALPASELRMVDAWQKVGILIQAPEAREFWIAPIETVSDSEEGFERIYQGSQILCVWALDIPPGESWHAGVSLQVQALE